MSQQTLLCPRARYNGARPRRFRVACDPAVQDIARRVVAGVDRQYDLHPHYRELVAHYRTEKAKELIRTAVEIPGACDIIQNDMTLGGMGLFGGLAKNETCFVFYEWSGPNQLKTWMTAQEARDIVARRKKMILFVPASRTRSKGRKKKRRQPSKAQTARTLWERLTGFYGD